MRCFNSVPRRWVRFSSGTCLYPPAIRGYVLAFSWKRLAGSEKRGPASDQDLLSVERSELTRRLALASSARLECGRGFDSRPRRRPPRRPRRAMVACASLVDSGCPPVHLSTREREAAPAPARGERAGARRCCSLSSATSHCRSTSSPTSSPWPGNSTTRSSSCLFCAGSCDMVARTWSANTGRARPSRAA